MSNCARDQHYLCNSWNSCGCSHHNGCSCYKESYCPYSCWRHPICCSQAYYSCAGTDNGPTLVIHKIVLEAGCEQSCTPRSFRIRVTGPSYPCGEVFTLRAGSCLELDEPLVISGLEPGQYRIEVLYDCPFSYTSTITGAECGGYVTVANSVAPTVVTIVSRRSICRARRRCGCTY